MKESVSMHVSISATGMANQTPVTLRIFGNIQSETVINPNVLKNEITAETFPFDSAVKNAEEKILHPENRKPKTKIENPVFVISNTFLLFPANIREMFSPAKKENRNTKTETAVIKAKQIRTTLFNCSVFSLP